MAHRTRKKLTKTELKKDPVNDALLKGMVYVQDHLKQILIAGAVLIVAVLVIQSLTGSSRRQSDEARAQYYLATQLYEMGMDNLVRYGETETGIGQIQAARQVAGNNYRNYPGRLPGKRSAILAAKIGIMFRMESEVISDMQDFLATDPGGDLRNSASLHLAQALENRGGGEDIVNARYHYNDILSNTTENSQLAWEAYSGLSRLDFKTNDYQSSLENLQTALEISRDTTDFVRYQLARLEMAMN
ncbi:MAG: hypothetical protein R6U39_11805 [Candidatus Aegiribacteria sp.]